MAEVFGALMSRLNFSHNEIMELPFPTFLAYQESLGKEKQTEDPEIEKWRADGQKWVEENKLKG